MGTRVTDLSTLDVAAVKQEEDLIASQLQEADPSLSMQQGVLRDYLAYFGGILGNKNQVEQDRLRRSQSVNEILVDPTLADDDTVDNIASNYRVTRTEGGLAGGAVTMVMDVLESLTVAAGTLFEAQGNQFITEDGFTARTSASDVVADTDRVLTPNGDGTYSFQITVIAVEEGEGSQLVLGTLVVPATEPLNFVKAFASEDFIGGLSAEDNLTLLERFIYGMAAKAFSGRENMSAALREEDVLGEIVDDSIIGLGDEEMLRDQHTIFPGSLGGRVDWYTRTQLLYRSQSAIKEATLISKTPDGKGIWQMSFGRDEYPGLYDVKVRPGDAAEDFLGFFEITGDIRTADMTALPSNDGFVPDVKDDVEAVYSRFQAVVIQFEDSLTDTGAMTELASTNDYTIVVRAMPLIEEGQDYALQRHVRNAMGDALVKAPVPCFLSLSFVIELEPGQLPPDTAQVARDLANLVNNYGFSGRLPASPLCDVVHNSLSGRDAATAIDMFGKIRRPDGVIRPIRSTELLIVPDEPGEMSTPKTVVFFLDPADVAISVVTADIPQV